MTMQDNEKYMAEQRAIRGFRDEITPENPGPLEPGREHTIVRDKQNNVTSFTINPLAYWNTLEDIPSADDERCRVDFADIPLPADGKIGDVTVVGKMRAAKYTCTTILYDYVMASRPSQVEMPLMDQIANIGTETGQIKDYPVTQVTWFSAVEFCNRLSIIMGLQPCYLSLIEDSCRVIYWDETLEGIRLPTYDEWTYIAKGGQNFRFAGSDDHTEVAWTYENSGGRIHIVGELKPNGYGLFDMNGNVWQWVWDGRNLTPK